jgi:hypothetical protein
VLVKALRVPVKAVRVLVTAIKVLVLVLVRYLVVEDLDCLGENAAGNWWWQWRE